MRPTDQRRSHLRRDDPLLTPGEGVVRKLPQAHAPARPYAPSSGALTKQGPAAATAAVTTTSASSPPTLPPPATTTITCPEAPLLAKSRLLALSKNIASASGIRENAFRFQ